MEKNGNKPAQLHLEMNLAKIGLSVHARCVCALRKAVLASESIIGASRIKFHKAEEKKKKTYSTKMFLSIP